MRKENEETAVSVIGRLAGKLILVALSVLIIFVIAKYAFNAGKGIFYQPPMEDAPGTDITVEITEDMNYSDLGALLKKSGIVRNQNAVAVQARLYKTELYPGQYTLNTSMTTKEILTLINNTAIAYKEAASAGNKESENVLGGGDEEGAAANEISGDSKGASNGE